MLDYLNLLLDMDWVVLLWLFLEELEEESTPRQQTLELISLAKYKKVCLKIVPRTQQQLLIMLEITSETLQVWELISSDLLLSQLVQH